MAQIIATRIAGVRISCVRLRPRGLPASGGRGRGMSSARNSTLPARFSTITARYDPRKVTAMASAVTFTNWGPKMADKRPPAMTQLIALGRKSSDAVSAAAKR